MKIYLISDSRVGRKTKHATKRDSGAAGALWLLLRWGGALRRWGIPPGTVSGLLMFLFFLLPLITLLLFQVLFLSYALIIVISFCCCPLPPCFGLIFPFRSSLSHHFFIRQNTWKGAVIFFLAIAWTVVTKSLKWRKMHWQPKKKLVQHPDAAVITVHQHHEN